MRFFDSMRGVGLALALFFPGIATTGTMAASEAGCTAQEARDAKDVAKDALSAAQIACILASPFLDSEHVMEACGLLREHKSVLEQLLSQKAAAQRASACQSPKDAGPDR